MYAQQCGYDSRIPQLIIPIRQQTSQHRLEQLEGKGCEVDDASGVCYGEGLPLTPRGKDYLRELLEKIDEDFHGVGREERDDSLGPLGVTLNVGVITVCKWWVGVCYVCVKVSAHVPYLI